MISTWIEVVSLSGPWWRKATWVLYAVIAYSHRWNLLLLQSRYFDGVGYGIILKTFQSLLAFCHIFQQKSLFWWQGFFHLLVLVLDHRLDHKIWPLWSSVGRSDFITMLQRKRGTASWWTAIGSDYEVHRCGPLYARIRCLCRNNLWWGSGVDMMRGMPPMIFYSVKSYFMRT